MIKALNQFLATLNNPLGQKLSGNEQLVLLHINNAMNTAYWAETLRLSDNSLLAMLNQYDSTGKPLSIETLRRVKQRLKGKGLIDFTSGKGSQISEYRLVKLYAEEPCPHPENTPADTPKQSPDELLNNNNNNSLSEDVKMLRQRVKKTCVRDAFNKVEDIEEDARVGYFGLSLEPKLQQLWEKNTRNGNRNLDGKLTDYEFTRLSKMQEKYGVEVLEVAMNKALGYNNAGFNHLEKTLSEMKDQL